MADMAVNNKEVTVEKQQFQHGRRAPQYFEEGRVVDSKFRIEKMIDCGGFGQIYRVVDEHTKSVMAIKIARESHEPARMILEQKVMLKLRGTPHIPQIFASGTHSGYNYIVMEILGRNLSVLRKCQPKRRLSVPTVIRVGMQTVAGLKAVHDIGYIHRDVKPSNICIGLHSHRQTIYIVDFGMARQFRFDDGMVRKERYYAGFRGTMRYVSVTVHERREQGPVDDLWSLFYSLIELVQGNLPWSALSDANDIAKIKKNISFDEFGRHVPKEMESIMRHLSQLRYHQTPDYALILDNLKESLPKDMTADMPYDWEMRRNGN